VCVDDPELMEFLKDRKRNLFPQHVIFKTTDIGQSHKSYWVEIIQQDKPFFESRIEAQVKDRRIEVKTQNVQRFALSLSSDLLPYGRIVFLIDGKKSGYVFRADRKVFFHKRGNRFRMGRSKSPPWSKSPEHYGPIKQAYFSPFVLVYGTKGDSLKTEITLHQARLEATRWWRRANGFVEILPDTEITREIMQDYNLILFGGPEENFITSKLTRNLPIRIKGKKILFGEKEISGDGIATEYIYPNPACPQKFIFVHQGVDLEGLKLSTFFTTLYSGAGLPDFIIFDDKVKYKGWGGVLGAGFFNSDWQMDEKLTYLQE